MRPRTVAIVLGVAALSTALLVAIGWPASAYRDNDFASFWVMGRMLLDGRDQYDFAAYLAAHRAIGSRALTIVVEGTPTFYPLTTALLCAVFAAFPLAVAAPLWLVSQIVAAAAAVVALGRRLFTAATLRRDLFVVLGLAASTQPAWLLAGGGNMGGFLLAIAASSAALLIDGRAFAAGAVAGLLVIKPHVLLFAFVALVLVLPRATVLRFLAGAGSVAGALTAFTLLLRPSWIAELLDQLGRIATYASRQATVFGLFGPDLAALEWVIVAACLIAYVVWARRARPSVPVLVAAAIPLSLFCARYGWSYDHLLLVITAAVVIGLVAASTPRARWTVILTLAVVLVPLTWALYGLAFQRGEESLSALVPLATLGVLALAMRLR
jgi:glycosyl transferase family 87